MKRNAFIMKLKQGFEAEYRKRHDEIWPELSEELAKAGVSDYSIFLDERTGTLFAFQKLADDNTADRLPEKEIMRRWWDYMADIMDINQDNSPFMLAAQGSVPHGLTVNLPFIMKGFCLM